MYTSHSSLLTYSQYSPWLWTGTSFQSIVIQVMPQFKNVQTYLITDAIFENNFKALEFYETPFRKHSLEQRPLFKTK